VVPERPAAITIGLLLVALITIVDVALGPGLQVTGLFTTPPFLAAVFVNARRTAIVGLVSLGANVGLAVNAHQLTQNSQLIRMGGVAVAAIGAVALTVVREREQRKALTIGHIAEVAQLAVLRVMPPTVGNATLGVRYVSASAEARVGGDFYEALRTERGMRAIVGDVRGKGLGSVQLANVLIGGFRGADHDQLTLAEVAIGMDKAFTRFEPSDEDFATAILIEVSHAGDLTVVNCGHPAPLLVSGVDVKQIDPPTPALPMGLGSLPRPTELMLQPGERVLLYTDGIIEARLRGSTFDLMDHAPALGQGSVDLALDRLVGALDTFLGGHMSDDVALLLLERT